MSAGNRSVPMFVEAELETPTNLAEAEAAVAQYTEQASQQLLKHWALQLTDDPPPPTTRCASCGGRAAFAGQERRPIRTGQVEVRIWRAYYVCSSCNKKTAPFDERLDPIQSLARLRQRRQAQIDLPVGEIAKSWDLGRLSRRSDAVESSDQSRSHPSLRGKEAQGYLRHLQAECSRAQESRSGRGQANGSWITRVSDLALAISGVK